MEDNRLFRLDVVSPERVFYSDSVAMVELKTTEGDIGIYKGHIPLTAVVAPGVLRIHEADGIREAALLEGIVRILGDSVTILAEACEWPEEIDVDRAFGAKERAELRLRGAEGEINVARAELALRRSLVRIELGRR